MDGVDRADPVNAAFLDDAALVARTKSTVAIPAADAARYDAVFFAGGHGTMWDFPDDAGVQSLIRTVYERGARFVEAPNFERKVAVSGRLVTGQNPASATGVAEAVVRAAGW